MKSLIVYLNNQQIGRLWLANKRELVFQYENTWLLNPAAIPLSLSLPLQSDIFEDDKTRPFFANLLPEAEQRRIIAQYFGVSEGNDYALLEELGGECAGAVTLLPEGVNIADAGEYRPLSKQALQDLINQLPKRPMLAGEEGVRLSLAGAQSKLPIFFNEETQLFSLPTGNAPSSHIIKPAIERLQHTVENEVFCMQLARQLGLPTPSVTVLALQQPAYLVQRYDRQTLDDDKLVRLHQEDFCQALSVSPDMKYEKEGGPSLKDCFQLVREKSIQPVADIKAMLNWVVFNYLIGNADAHAKNISLLLTEHGPRLAPFYDLLSTAVYPELTQKLAMRIGGEDRSDWIIARKWQQFADDIGINHKLVINTLIKMSEQLLKEAHALKAEFASQYGDCEIIDKLIKLVEQRAAKVRKIVAATEK